MKAIVAVWILGLLALTGLGVWATYSNKLIDAAEDFNFSVREDSKTKKRPAFFPAYFKGRSPTGGGFGFGK